MSRSLHSFLGLALRNLGNRKSRTLLTAGGIVLGVAVVLAISITNESTVVSIRRIFDEASGSSDLVVTSSSLIGDPFDGSALPRVRRFAGVQMAAPSVSGRTLLASHAGEWGVAVSMTGARNANDLLLLGIDPSLDRQVRDYDLVAGSFLPNELDSYAAILVKDYADEEGLSVGEELVILTPAGQESLRIVGLIRKSGPGMQNNGAVAVVPLQTAQIILEEGGDLTQLDVLVTSDICSAPGKLEEFKSQLAAELGSGYQVLYPAARGQIVARMLASYQTGLSFFSAVALFVGAFLIYNTFTMTVVERTREIGMLRTLGATRAQITLLILTEAAVLGALGSLLGLGLGVLLSRGLIRSMATVTITDITETQVPLDGLASALLIGLGVTLVSALLPAWRARNVSPLEALRAGAMPQSTPLGSHGWISGSLLMIMAYLGLYHVPLRPDVQNTVGMVCVFVLLLGATLVVPITIGVAERALRPAMAVVYGGEGRLGASNIRRARARTALTVAALMVGIAMVIGIQAMTASLEIDINSWVKTAIGGDLYVRSPIPMRDEFGQRLLSDPAVQAVSAVTYRQVRRVRPGGSSDQTDSVVFKGLDPHTYDQVASFVFENSTQDTASALAQLAEGDALLISTALADRYDLEVGDALNLETRRGRHAFRVAGVVVDFSNQGYVVNGSRSDLARYYSENTADQFIIALKPGYDAKAEAQHFEDRYGTSQHISVETAADFREQVTTLSAEAFALFDVLGLIGVIIAALGVVNTLMMNVFERQREIGGLRSLGMTKGQVARLVLAESGAMGVIGGAFGMYFGMFLARVFLQGVQEIAGYAVNYHLPLTALLIGWAIALAVSQIAALYPAWKAANVRIIEAIQHE